MKKFMKTMNITVIILSVIAYATSKMAGFNEINGSLGYFITIMICIANLVGFKGE